MFTNIRVSNFKSLVDLNINLLTKKKNPKQLVLIYGENGSGKTNLISIFYTLIESLRTMQLRDTFQELLQSNDVIEKNKELLMDLLKHRFKDLESIIKESKTIDSQTNLYMEFQFEIQGKKGLYSMEFDDKRIIEEKLNFVLEKKRGSYFELSQKEKRLNPSVFQDKDYLEEIKNKIDKFWGKHTLLSILLDDISEKNAAYFKNKLIPNIGEVLDFLDGFSCQINVGNSGKRATYGIDHPMLAHLLSGQIQASEINELHIASEFLNEIFTALYADIKEVYYNTKSDEKKIKYELYCRKMIGGKLRDVPFTLESTGTLTILGLIPGIIMAAKGRTVVIDEFDSGIHDVMVRDILSAVNSSITGQLIVTTHNTLLMESEIENDALYFLTVDADGKKELLCLDDYEHRTHPNHNIRSLYLKGLYNGIPLTRELDFSSIIEIMDSLGVADGNT